MIFRGWLVHEHEITHILQCVKRIPILLFKWWELPWQIDVRNVFYVLYLISLVSEKCFFVCLSPVLAMPPSVSIPINGQKTVIKQLRINIWYFSRPYFHGTHITEIHLFNTYELICVVRIWWPDLLLSTTIQAGRNGSPVLYTVLGYLFYFIFKFCCCCCCGVHYFIKYIIMYLCFRRGGGKYGVLAVIVTLAGILWKWKWHKHSTARQYGSASFEKNVYERCNRVVQLETDLLYDALHTMNYYYYTLLFSSSVFIFIWHRALCPSHWAETAHLTFTAYIYRLLCYSQADIDHF